MSSKDLVLVTIPVKVSDVLLAFSERSNEAPEAVGLQQVDNEQKRKALDGHEY